MKLRLAADLTLPLDAVTQTIVVYGGKGMGKTNLGSVLAEELHAAKRRFTYIDPMGVAWGLQHGRQRNEPGLPVLILGGVHGDLPIEPTAAAIVADLVVDEDVSTVIDISRRPNGTAWAKAEKIRFVRDYFTRLYERQAEKRRPIMQILDEAARYAPQQLRAGDEDIAQCLGAIEMVCEEGRNLGIGLTLLTQRSARLNKNLAELADMLVAFRVVGPNSIGAVMEWFGEHIPKERHRGLVEQIRKLDVGQALIVSPGWLEIEGAYHIRMRETFDSSRTPRGGRELHAPGKATKPDLEKYRDRMVATIERAKADDPKELRRQLALQTKRATDLEQQLTRAQQKPASAADREATKAAHAQLKTDVVRYRRALEAAMKILVKVKAIDFEVNTEEGQKALAAAVADAVKQITAPIEKRVIGLVSRVEGVKLAAKHAEEAIQALLEEKIDLTVQVEKREPFVVTAPKPPRAPRTVTPAAPAGTVAGERKILIAAAQYPQGATREQLSILVGLKRSTRDRYVQYLVQRGHVAVENGLVRATQAGIELLGPDYEPLPTGQELQAYWLARLPEGERRILEVAINEHPNAVSRDRISELVFLQRSTRDRYVQYLQSRKLVTVDRSGVRASEELF